MVNIHGMKYSNNIDWDAFLYNDSKVTVKQFIEEYRWRFFRESENNLHLDYYEDYKDFNILVNEEEIFIYNKRYMVNFHLFSPLLSGNRFLFPLSKITNIKHVEYIQLDTTGWIPSYPAAFIIRQFPKNVKDLYV